MGNVVTAQLTDERVMALTEPLYQYDYGQVLQITGMELPEAYEVHFGNEPMSGDSTMQIGGADGVSIPDMYLTSGEPVYAWLFLHTGAEDGETVRTIKIPVKKRARRTSVAPTPVQQYVITQAIALLNAAVAQCEANVSHYPVVIEGLWAVWNASSEEYVLTSVPATGPQGPTGLTPAVSIGTVTYSTNPEEVDVNITGTTDEPVLNFVVPKGTKGDKGDPFTVKKTFASIAAMMEYAGTDVVEGDFVVISSDTQDPDNGKLYIKTSDSYQYLTDLSGAQGMKGDDGNGIASITLNQDYTLTITFTDTNSVTVGPIRGDQGVPGPQGETGPAAAFSIGTVATGAAGTAAAVTMTGTNLAPVLNFTIPQGATGEVTDDGNGNVTLNVTALNGTQGVGF